MASTAGTDSTSVYIAAARYIHTHTLRCLSLDWLPTSLFSLTHRTAAPQRALEASKRRSDKMDASAVRRLAALGAAIGAGAASGGRKGVDRFSLEGKVALARAALSTCRSRLPSIPIRMPTYKVAYGHAAS